MDTRKIEDVPFEEVHEIQRYGTYFSEKSIWPEDMRQECKEHNIYLI